jgi:hypothetical protein
MKPSLLSPNHGSRAEKVPDESKLFHSAMADDLWLPRTYQEENIKVF